MIVSLFLSLVVLIGLSIYSGSIGVFVFLSLFIVLGVFISLVLSGKSKSEFKILLLIFFTAYISYFLYALIANIDYVKYGFSSPDPEHFFGISEQLGVYSSIKSIFIDCFIHRIHFENEGAHFLFGTLAYIANNLFDGNSVFYQSINVTFFAVLINLFVYKTLSFYVDQKKAFKYTLFYLFFAYVLSYSPSVTRDAHITLFYAIAIYLIHLPFSLKRLFLLLIIQVVTIEFRFEHGLAFTFFPLLFLYDKASNSEYRKIYLALIISFTLFVLFLSLNQIVYAFENISRMFEAYKVITGKDVEESGGLGALLYNLPFGIRHIAIVLASQITPFPPWYYLENSKWVFQVIMNIVSGIAPVFWGYIVFVNVLNINKYYKKMSCFFLLLIAFMLLFFFANTANINVRRLLAVYPIMYTLFVYIQSQLSEREKERNRLQYIYIYSSLIVLYLVIKIL